MNSSPAIAALASALCLAQSQMQTAKKDSKGNYGRYADLASIWEACREPLHANDLAIMQTFLPSEPQYVTIETILAHKSGEWVSSVLNVPTRQLAAQDYGSAITYARRYSLAAMVGICPDDDDGQAAQDAATRIPRAALESHGEPPVTAATPHMGRAGPVPEMPLPRRQATRETLPMILPAGGQPFPGKRSFTPTGRDL